MTTKAQAAGLELGKKYKVINASNMYTRFGNGDIVTFTRDDGSEAPEFTRDSDGTENYLRLAQVEAVPTTPAEKAGLKIGTTYRMKPDNSHEYPAGTLVKFTDDDGSYSPRFDLSEELDADGWNFLDIRDIDPTPVEVNAAVTFEDSTINVPVEITIITVKRKLTQQERDAIAAIIK